MLFGSNLGTVINTRTREDPWEELRELKALATFSAKRNLVLDLQKDAFFDRAWKVKCVDTTVRSGRVYITLETVRGENPALTAQEKAHGTCRLNCTAKHKAQTFNNEK